MRPFHLAIPCHDLEAIKHFYTDMFDCAIGREAEKWVDFNFFGHQLSIHLKPEEVAEVSANAVDGKAIPVRHFGIVLEWSEWHILSKKLQEKGVEFIVEPYIRFEGEAGEQATLFLKDPSHNMLEFKAFKDDAFLFAREK